VFRNPIADKHAFSSPSLTCKLGRQLGIVNMEHDKIQQVLEGVPEKFHSKTRFFRHFFYGPAPKLRRLRRQLNGDGANFESVNDSLVVTLPNLISRDAIKKITDLFEGLADDLELEYDGFEISLGDEIQEKSPPPFEKYFSPATYVRFSLDERRFGYLLFVGGCKKDYIFDCLSLVDNGQSDVLKLDAASRLYRQPVRAVIDPSQVAPVGQSALKMPQKISFRMATDFPTPAEMDDLAKTYGIAPEERDAKWGIILEKMYRAGDTLRRGSFTEYIANISPKNKITWTSASVTHDKDSHKLPWSAGAFATLDMFRDALLGRPDFFAMNDAVY
jgi:hypothetical protein